MKLNLPVIKPKLYSQNKTDGGKHNINPSYVDSERRWISLEIQHILVDHEEKLPNGLKLFVQGDLLMEVLENVKIRGHTRDGTDGSEHSQYQGPEEKLSMKQVIGRHFS